MTRMIHFLTLLLLSSALWAQSRARLQMNLQGLEEKADEVVSVNLEGKSLDEGRKMLAVREGVKAPVKQMVKSLKGIYMRIFRFGRRQAYSPEDLAPIQEQLETPGWVPMIDVRDRRKTETVTVYSYVENEEVAGMTVVSAEPQEFTVVNIVGPVDLETLSELGKQIGIPSMRLATPEITRKKLLPPDRLPPDAARE